jgi:hypothetical protein
MGIKKVFLRKKVLRVFMDSIAFSIQKNIKPNSNPQTPKIPLSPLSHKGAGGLISRGRKWHGQTARRGLRFICNVVDHALSKTEKYTQGPEAPPTGKGYSLRRH